MERELKWLKKYNDDDWIYEIDEGNTARFVLGVTGDNPLVCFGINTSTAEPLKPDATLQRVERYAYKHGYDSWIMLNVYPQRATDPKHLHITLDQSLHQKNLEVIDKVLKKGDLKLWAAWGTLIDVRPYLCNCLNDIKKIASVNNCKWYSVIDGIPVHPLYRVKGFKLYESDLIPLSI